MSKTTIDLEQAFQRYGDELYRLALLLTPDESHAAALLVRAAAPAPPHYLRAVEEAPAECQPTRAALALGGELVHLDPALRGHLVLCAACREAEETWQTLTTTVEHALRGALRDVRLPGELAA